MISFKNPSKSKDLQQLAEELSTFPITGYRVVQYAEQNGYDVELVKFLNLFSKERVFSNRSEFLDYCRLFKRLAGEKHIAVS